jgi:hypothetical protein
VFNHIVPGCLPHVGFSERRALPAISAVYFALGRKGEVFYIGRSVNVLQRWATLRSHHAGFRLQAMECAALAWYELPLHYLEEVEKACIEDFRPIFNQPWIPLHVSKTYWKVFDETDPHRHGTYEHFIDNLKQTFVPLVYEYLHQRSLTRFSL